LRSIGKRCGKDVRSVWMRMQLLEAAYGKLPSIERHDKRDYARDYVLIKDLRDAGMPWKSICLGLNMTAGAAAVYYHGRLKKIFDVACS
jgi:hypothetical protein